MLDGFNPKAPRHPWSMLTMAALFFFGFGTNTYLDAANPSRAVSVVAHAQHNNGPKDGKGLSFSVLNSRDASLYRAAFTAQSRGDWVTADQALSLLTDHRLEGYVLAERYRAQNAGLDELAQWLGHYQNLPIAKDIYRLAKAKSGFSARGITPPPANDLWSASGHYDTGLDFSAPASKNQDRAKRAARLFYSGKIVEARDVALEATRSGTPLALWIEGLSAWRLGNPQAASLFFALLAAQSGLPSADRAAAAYWAYRALRRSGNNDRAYYWLNQAAKEQPSFYSLMANNLLERAPAWEWNLPKADAKELGHLARTEAGWRAMALVQVGKPGYAEMELRRLNPQGQRGLQRAMLSVATGAELPSLTMLLGGIATNDNGKPFDAALFPLPPWQPEGGFVMDRALLFAMMRHESRFDPEAQSAQGACGLMQIMPSTAQVLTTNRLEKTGHDCPPSLLDPVTNITLGQNYVRHLATRTAVGNNLLFLLAAYNGGPARISKKMDDAVKRDPLLYIESFPSRETRDYMREVLTHNWTYRARLGNGAPSLYQLAHGEWPSLSLTNPTGQPIEVKDTTRPFRLAQN